MATERSVTNNQIAVGRLFNTAYFIGKQGLSFKKYPELCKLQTKNDIGSGKNYLSDVACKRFISSIGDTLKDDLRDSFNNACFVSVVRWFN